MFAYLALTSNSSVATPQVEERVRRAAAVSLEWVKELRDRRWISPTTRSGLWVWTNEPEDVTGELATGEHAAVLRIGTLDRDMQALLAADDVTRAVAGRAGDYSLVRLKDDTVTAVSTFARQTPVYSVKAGEIVCVTNRALLGHLFTRDGQPLDFDLEALAACVATGYGNAGFWTERVPFRGVSIAPPASIVETAGGDVSTRDHEGAHARFARGRRTPDAEFYDELAELFLNGLRRLPLPPSVDVALTGGKDSRVLVSALTNLDVELRTGTVGFDTDPDVVLATKIAGHLGLPHRQTVPPSSTVGDDPTVSWDLRGNIGRELLVFDGMMFTVERLPRTVSNVASTLDATFAAASPSLTTKGAEIWRAGYANRDFSWIPSERETDDVTADEIERTVKDLWLRNIASLLPDVAAAHEGYVSRWLESVGIEEQPLAAAERFYLDFEIGRRDPPYFFHYELSRPTYQPFMQHEIVRRVSELDVRFRRDDHIHYELISRFTPGVENFPLERKRWGFEWSRPRSEGDRAAWEAREPLPMNDRTYGAWPLYGAVGSDYWRTFGDALFGYEDGNNIWSFLSRRKLQELFTSDLVFDPHVSASFWVAYGLSVLMSGEWLAGAQPEQVISARHRVPWPAIYHDLVRAVRSAEEMARNDVSDLFAVWADETSPTDLAAPAGGPEDGSEHVLFEGPAMPRATLYPGSGRTIAVEASGKGAELIEIAADPESEPANSYIALPLGRIQEPTLASVAVSFSHRSTGDWIGRMYLVEYGPERSELDGPVVSYGRVRDTLRHTFTRAATSDNGGRSDFALLLGLGAESGRIELSDLRVTTRRRPSPVKALESVSARLRQMSIDIDNRLTTLSGEHGLSPREIDDLRLRAGLDATPAAAPTSLAEFAEWLLNEAERSRAAGETDLGSQLVARGADAWPFLQPLVAWGDDVLASLLES